MSADTVSIRPSLRHSRKVFAMSRHLANAQEFRNWFGLQSQIFPNLEAIKILVMGGVALVWGMARTHSLDGFFRAGVLTDLDELAGIPQFGAAMEVVGWAEVIDGGVRLPNFSEWNKTQKKRGGAHAASFGEEDVIPGLTGDQKARFETFWNAYPRKVGKGAARKKWGQLRPSEHTLAKMLQAITEQKQSDQWKASSGQFVPHPTTWLNQTRWEDSLKGAARPEDLERDERRQAAQDRARRLAEENAPIGG